MAAEAERVLAGEGSGHRYREWHRQGGWAGDEELERTVLDRLAV